MPFVYDTVRSERYDQSYKRIRRKCRRRAKRTYYTTNKIRAIGSLTNEWTIQWLWCHSMVPLVNNRYEEYKASPLIFDSIDGDLESHSELYRTVQCEQHRGSRRWLKVFIWIMSLTPSEDTSGVRRQWWWKGRRFVYLKGGACKF